MGRTNVVWKKWPGSAEMDIAAMVVVVGGDVT